MGAAAEAGRSGRAYLYAGGTVLLWSTVASAFKLSLAYLRPLELLFYASLTSSLFLLLWVGFAGGLRVYRNWSPQDLLYSAWLGLLNPCLYYLVLFEAYDRLPAQQAQPLNFTWPIVLTLLAAVVLRQRLRPPALLGLVVSFSGVVVVTTQGVEGGWREADRLGIGLALGSSFFWAVYWVSTARDRTSPVPRLCMNFLFGTGYLLLLMVLSGGLGPVPWQGLAGAVYVGLCEMGLAFVLWLRALQLAPSTARIGNLVYLSPLLSLLFIHWLVGERILPGTMLGLGLILAGILVQARAGQNH